MAGLKLAVPNLVVSGGRPAAACEISQAGVLAAATPGAGQAAVYAAESLAHGSVVPGLAEGNLTNPGVVTAALKAALGQVQPRVKAVTVVVPDSAVRVFVLDFDTMPTRADEALPVLRFRLRKSVPFDVEHAGISYQVLSEGSARLETQWKVLAAVIPGPVLAEYEAVVRAAGYEPGVVLPASLAVLAAIGGTDSHEAVLVIHLSQQALTTSIVSGNDILLYRTVELPQETGLRQVEVQRAVAVAAAFYEDQLHVRARRILYSGVVTAREFAALVQDEDLEVVELAGRPDVGFASSLGNHSVAAVTGALVGTN